MSLQWFHKLGSDDVADTYRLSTIPAFTESVTLRMLADGIVLQDIRSAATEVAGWAGWGQYWIDRAKAHENSAEDSVDRGRWTSAADHLTRAALCAHYAQFLYFAYPEIKREAAELKVRLFRRAAPLLRWPAEALEIDFKGTRLPGYLRLPAGSGPHPCVVLIGGLDATKEDFTQVSDLCLARGLATFAFDGPGQGEAYYRGSFFGPEWRSVVPEVVDTICRSGKVDRERIGVLGRSLGGFLAPWAASVDKRIRACVAWGALYDLAEFDRKPPLIKDGYQFITGASGWDDAKKQLAFVTLDGAATNITCSLYVLHGGRDNSVPSAQAERLASEAHGRTCLQIWPESIHCCHDVAHIVRPAMVDWLVGELSSPPAH